MDRWHDILGVNLRNPTIYTKIMVSKEGWWSMLGVIGSRGSLLGVNGWKSGYIRDPPTHIAINSTVEISV